MPRWNVGNIGNPQVKNPIKDGVVRRQLRASQLLAINVRHVNNHPLIHFLAPGANRLSWFGFGEALTFTKSTFQSVSNSWAAIDRVLLPSFLRQWTWVMAYCCSCEKKHSLPNHLNCKCLIWNQGNMRQLRYLRSLRNNNDVAERRPETGLRIGIWKLEEGLSLVTGKSSLGMVCWCRGHDLGRTLQLPTRESTGLGPWSSGVAEVIDFCWQPVIGTSLSDSCRTWLAYGTVVFVAHYWHGG